MLWPKWIWMVQLKTVSSRGFKPTTSWTRAFYTLDYVFFLVSYSRSWSRKLTLRFYTFYVKINDPQIKNTDESFIQFFFRSCFVTFWTTKSWTFRLWRRTTSDPSILWIGSCSTDQELILPTDWEKNPTRSWSSGSAILTSEKMLLKRWNNFNHTIVTFKTNLETKKRKKTQGPLRVMEVG